MQEKVLLTKLQLPPPRPNLVHRQRLIEHLNEGLSEGKALTLVSAPAGYGKSVLIAEWLRSLLRQEHNKKESHSTYDACWISLEPSDSEPARFLSYLNSAIRDSNVDIVFEIRSIDDWVNFTAVEWLLTDIINCLSGQNQPPLIIVLDDYHQISNPVIHRMTQFLIDHRPPQLHLVILTREDPPLPLSRFRANAEMTELRAEELRFNHDEAAAFINQTMHLSLEAESIHSLTKRTEGWIAGLQLAALSLRQKSNAEAEIGQFLGSNRYLVDYLMDEVIKTQPDDIKDFLSKTALLKRFTPKLCDLLTDRNDSVSILKLFEQANLFLIPLDDECAWYRYHHLFSDCLRKMLPVHDPIQLYRKAVHYCLKYELLEEAADYALASEDFNLAANTIESVMNNPQVWSSGQLNMLEGWLKAIPDACFANRPGLQVAAARAYSLAGRFDQAELLLERAEQALIVRAQEGQTNSDQNINLAQTGIYRAAIMAVGGHLEAASRQIAQARIHLPPDNKHVEARALVTMAMIEEQTGNLVQAEGHYLEAAACAMTAGVTYLAVNALCETAIVRQLQGRLNDAEQVCRDAVQLALHRTFKFLFIPLQCCRHLSFGKRLIQFGS